MSETVLNADDSRERTRRNGFRIIRNKNKRIRVRTDTAWWERGEGAERGKNNDVPR